MIVNGYEIKPGANLKGADLRNTDLTDGNLTGANLEKANLEGANLAKSRLENVNLRGANLENAYLSYANFKEADLSGANLKGVNLATSGLERANLKNANLMYANLIAANLKGANLQKANLEHAQLVNADLTGADLRGASLAGEFLGVNNLHGAKLTNIIYDSETIWPEYFSFPSEMKAGKHHSPQSMRVPETKTERQPQKTDYQVVKNLLDEGVVKKRAGDYLGAKKTYYKAIQIDPHRKMGFSSLAKICYLTGEQEESVLNYVRAAHLLFHEPSEVAFNPDTLRTMINPVLSLLPLEYHNDPDIYEKLTPLVLDLNTSCHLAHALIDLDDDISKPPQLLPYIAFYRTSLAGKGGELNDEIENGYYQPIGLQFLLDAINWRMLDSWEVLKIYPEPSRKNVGISLAAQDSINSQEALADKHHSQGVLYARHNRLDEASKEFQKALRYNPNHAEARYNLGLVYVQYGELDKAVEHVKYALKLGLEDAHMLLAEIEEQQKKSKKSFWNKMWKK